MRPHRRQSTRLPHPWDSPGKNTGVGCHFLLQCIKVRSESEVSHVQLLATPWTAAYQAPPSMGFSRQESWSGVLLPSLSVKPSFSLIFLHMSAIIAHCLGLRSPGFQYSRPSHSTNKSPHQIAINNVLAHSYILFSWSLNTLLHKCIPLSAREMKPGGNFKLDFSVWFQPTPKQPQML